MVKARARIVPAARTIDPWLLVLAGAGIVLSAYLTWTRAAHAPVYCPLGAGCEVVQSSRYAAVFGIPVALLGLLFYAYLLVLAAGRLDPARRTTLALPAAFAGVGASAVFTSVQQAIIHATCSLCLVSSALTLAILVVLLVRPRRRLSALGWTLSALSFAAAALFLVAGYASSAPPPPEQAYAEGLARHLTATGVKLYGAYWCPHCTDQKAMFGKAAASLPYIECDPRSPAGKPAVCVAAKIRAFPTWDIAGGRHEGVLSLAELASLSGYPPPP